MMRGGAAPRRDLVRFRMADISVNLSAESPMKLAVFGAMDKFLVESGEPDVEVAASFRELNSGVAGAKIFESGSLWQLYRDNGNHVFRMSFAGSEVPYKVARFNLDFSRGEVSLNTEYWKADEPHDPLGYPLDELLIINLLANGRGAEVHASGIIDASGKAYLFIGNSSAGKTTMTRLWAKHDGVKVLSDDRIIIRKRNGAPRIYGTPWHGEGDYALNAQAPLDAVFFLKQWPKNEIVPLRKVEAAARFVSCAFIPFYNPAGLEFTLGFLDAIVNEVPCYELRFVPDQTAVDFVRQTSR